MTELRRRMDEAMIVRGFAVRTRETYLDVVKGLAKHYRRSPDLITDAEIQAYVLYLIRDRQRSWSTCHIVVYGLRFFYHETLPRDRTTFTISSPRQPGKLPALLSREEVQRLIAHAPHLTHRTMLLTRPPSSGGCGRSTGSSMRSAPSVVRRRCSSTSGGTRTAWHSRMIGSSTIPMVASGSGGGTTRTTTA